MPVEHFELTKGITERSKNKTLSTGKITILQDQPRYSHPETATLEKGHTLSMT